MGIMFTRLFSSLFGNKEARILVLGLDNAGKTTILYRLQMGEVVSTIPTIGFNVETVQYNNIKFQVWDLGGQTSIRPYWRCYFPNTQAIIYVVDSSDTERLVIAKDEFHAILEEEELRGAVVLIFANKQVSVITVFVIFKDLPGALDDAAVTEALELHKIKNRQWAIFKTSAIKGEGLFEGLDCNAVALSSFAVPLRFLHLQVPLEILHSRWQLVGDLLGKNNHVISVTVEGATIARMSGSHKALKRLHSNPQFRQLCQEAFSSKDKKQKFGGQMHEIDAFSREIEAGSRACFFEDLGLYYIGPVDGHNLEDLAYVLKQVKAIPDPGAVLIHVITEKEKAMLPLKLQQTRCMV
ncbi:hypothetical protein WN943_002838 [Citrus x changshan-huyou]